ILREARSDGRSTVLAEGEGWTALVSRWTHGADVTVTAVSGELAQQRLDEAVKDAEEQPEPESDKVSMGFWYHSPTRGPRRTTRPSRRPPRPPRGRPDRAARGGPARRAPGRTSDPPPRRRWPKPSTG